MSYFTTRLAIPARDDVTPADINFVTGILLRRLGVRKEPISDEEIEELLARHGLKLAEYRAELDFRSGRFIITKEGEITWQDLF